MRDLIPKIILRAYHYFLALTGAFLYGFGSKKITVIGVTGTSGKSTTVEFLNKILQEAGFKTASMSSLKFSVAEKETKNMLKMTMPGRFKIKQFLKKAVKENCRYAIIEVTSEGIKQFRHKFINFEVCVFTNLSEEHIESHGSFENYRKAKLRLFEENPTIHVINQEDENYKYFWQTRAKQKVGYNLKEDQSLIPPGLIGFNRYNALAAAKTAIALGISGKVCLKALSEIDGIEGRLEIIAKEPFTVVIDYAHTPEQLKKVYEIFKDKNKVCVLGSCGGGRDKWKRPVMGQIAQKYCQKVIITNEDPYEEDPQEIINQVAGSTFSEKIMDRKEAIKKALSSAEYGDVVIITGKGSEPWMCVRGNKKIPWSDKKIALEELEKLKVLA